jgi:excinuclease UvrABC ATPase subunit
MPKGIYQRTTEQNKKISKAMRGKRNPAWKGGISKNVRKYQRKYYQKKREKLEKYKLQKGCYLCGYKKCAKALDLHHFKERGIKRTQSLITYSWERIKKELKKSIVVCCRCHRELHAGLLTYP